MMGDSQGNGGTTNFSGSCNDFRFKKLEMLVFDGTNPDGWILKAEMSIAFHRFSNKRKLR